MATEIGMLIEIRDAINDLVAGEGDGLTNTELRASPVPTVQTGALPTGANNIGSVTAVPEKASSANLPAIVTAAGDLLVANSARKGFSVQNLGTNVLYLRLATGASSSVFHILLKGCTAQDDGTGGFYSDNTYTGIVSAAGTSPRLVVMEV